MKTLKNLKALIVITVCALLSISGVVFAQNGQLVSPFETTTPSITVPVAPVTDQIKTDIKSDVNAVKYQRDRVKSLGKRYKTEKAEGRTTAMAATQKQLIRAKGDLAASRAYLKADKFDLINSHNVAIAARMDVIKRDKARLTAAKVRLDKDIAAGNEATVDENALAVVKHQNALKRDKVRLSDAKANKYEDVLAVNKEIKKVNGEFPVSLYAENAVLKTENWMGMRK